MRASVQFPMLVAAASCAACVASIASPDLTPQGSSVRVYPSHAEVPSGCTELGRLEIIDGNTESSKGYMYQGTRDRALIRLRNASAARGGNAVVIDDEGDVLMVDGPEVGEYYIAGQALQCDARSN